MSVQTLLHKNEPTEALINMRQSRAEKSGEAMKKSWKHAMIHPSSWNESGRRMSQASRSARSCWLLRRLRTPALTTSQGRRAEGEVPGGGTSGRQAPTLQTVFVLPGLCTASMYCVRAAQRLRCGRGIVGRRERGRRLLKWLNFLSLPNSLFLYINLGLGLGFRI